MTLEAYCVKCKTKREIANPQPVWTARGTPAVKGTCPVCGTTLFHMGATEAHATLPKPVIEAAARPARKSAAKGKTSKTKAKTKSKTTTKTATTKSAAATATTAKAKTAKKSTAAKADKK